jgi:hypothetical protein
MRAPRPVAVGRLGACPTLVAVLCAWWLPAVSAAADLPALPRQWVDTSEIATGRTISVAAGGSFNPLALPSPAT